MFSNRFFAHSLLLFMFALCGSAQAQVGQKVADIVVFFARGDVSAYNPDTGEQLGTLTKGTTLPVGTVVQTGSGSKAVLLFSNGSSITLKAGTEMIIKEYSCQDYQLEGNIADLTEEPSKSNTRLELKRGELIGNVKKLNYDAGSSYEIESPIGTAGIRGTDWTMTVVIGSDGVANGVFGISNGFGIFVGSNGTPSDVNTLTVIEVSGTYNEETGEVVVTSVREVPMSQENAAEIESEVVELGQLLEQASSVILDNSGNNSGNNGQGQGEGGPPVFGPDDPGPEILNIDTYIEGEDSTDVSDNANVDVSNSNTNSGSSGSVVVPTVPVGSTGSSVGGTVVSPDNELAE